MERRAFWYENGNLKTRKKHFATWWTLTKKTAMMDLRDVFLLSNPIAVLDCDSTTVKERNWSNLHLHSLWLLDCVVFSIQHGHLELWIEKTLPLYKLVLIENHLFLVCYFQIYFYVCGSMSNFRRVNLFVNICFAIPFVFLLCVPFSINIQNSISDTVTVQNWLVINLVQKSILIIFGSIFRWIDPFKHSFLFDKCWKILLTIIEFMLIMVIMGVMKVIANIEYITQLWYEWKMITKS